MKKLMFVVSILVIAGMIIAHQWQKPEEVEAGVVCFKTGERISGMNKICFYDCMGSGTAITIGAVELCPLTIKR